MESNLKKELDRAIANSRYERTETGILFPGSNLHLGGVFSLAVNGELHEEFHNLVVDQFLDSALEQLFGGTAKIGTYYLAPYAGAVDPQASWTAANFTSNSTEFTAYDEAARQAWTVGAASSGSIGNSASRASFTVSAAPSQTTIWGAGLLSASAKSSTAGVLVAAARAGSARSGLVEGDVVTIGYTISLADDGA